MLYRFKQHVTLDFPRKEIDEETGKERDIKETKTFPCGNREVDEEAEAHPFFLKLVKAGLVVESDAVKDVPQESDLERRQRLYDRLKQKKGVTRKVENEKPPIDEEKSVAEEESPSEGKKKRK